MIVRWTLISRQYSLNNGSIITLDNYCDYSVIIINYLTFHLINVYFDMHVVSATTFVVKQICRFSLFSGRNVRWPHRMLPPGELRMYANGTNRRTDGRQTVTLCYSLDAASVSKSCIVFIHTRSAAFFEILQDRLCGY